MKLPPTILYEKRDRIATVTINRPEAICEGGPLAVQTAKEIAVRSLTLEPGFVLEKALGARVFSSEDAKEGPRAFSEKRPPQFTGR
ncbi:MAG: hypothetical protein IIC88_07970 [Chloroflexi bacterium]|nr:hypothetical protein [Chloroflexota bacterium]